MVLAEARLDLLFLAAALAEAILLLVRAGERCVERSLSSVAAVFCLALLYDHALAQSQADTQSYPSRPIRIIVANTAGSAMDNVTAYLRAETERFSRIIKLSGLASGQ